MAEKHNDRLMKTIDARLEEVLNLGIKINPATSNPGALGLYAFGFTTTLLMCNNVQVVDSTNTSFVWAYALFFGGLAQFSAGLMEYQRRNTFGCTVFTAYGTFWMGLGFYGTMVQAGIFPASVQGTEAILSLWGIFTVLLWLCTFSTNLVISVLFFILSLLFFFLAIGQTRPTFMKFAGIWGWVVSALAWYAATAVMLEDTYGKPIFPVFPMRPINKLSAGFIGTKRRTDREIAQPTDMEAAQPHPQHVQY